MPLLLSLGFAVAMAHSLAAKTVLRVGYFPNITHAQGVVGAHLTREGRGWFEARLGPDVEIRWFAFNAGPSAMEAMLAGSLDLTYVGPNPALNAYMRSRGSEIRLLAGAAQGGAALVVRGGAGITSPPDFRGRRIATPQLGNTQDVAARVFLRAQGFRVALTGGDVQVVPTANPEQLTLMAAGRIDAAWTVEPWVTRLIQEAGAAIFLEQPEAVTTLLAGSVRFLRGQPALAASFCQAHVDLTSWLNEHPAEAREMLRAALAAEVRREVPAALVEEAWSRLKFTAELPAGRLDALVRDAQSVGFLADAIPLDRLVSGRP